jgi:hypothetical protein
MHMLSLSKKKEERKKKNTRGSTRRMLREKAPRDGIDDVRT